MTSIDQMVTDMIRSYPGLYTSRGDVLHSLLCSTNRYLAWVDGAPVDTKAGDLPVFNEERLMMLVNSSTNPKVKEARKADLALMKQVSFEAEERSQMLTLSDDIAMYAREQYPTVLILNLPDNLTPDWQVEVDRFRTFLADNHGWRFDQEYLDRAFGPRLAPNAD